MPEEKKSISWVSQMNQKELDALKTFVSSWPFVKDHHGEFRFSNLTFCKHCFELWIDERGLRYSKTIQDLMTGMSLFLEAFRAACKVYNIQQAPTLKDPQWKE